jgi:hypothetical protein
MQLRAFLTIGVLLQGVGAQACELSQHPVPRVISVLRSNASASCSVDLESPQMWFNREGQAVSSVKILTHPERGRATISGSGRINYSSTEGWLGGKDIIIVQFYLGDRLQQVTIMVGYASHRI